MQTSSPFLWKWKLGWSYPLIFNYIGLSQILIHISNPNFSFYKTSSLEVSFCPCPHPPPSLPIKSINSDSQCPVAPSYQLVLLPWFERNVCSMHVWDIREVNYKKGGLSLHWWLHIKLILSLSSFGVLLKFSFWTLIL